MIATRGDIDMDGHVTRRIHAAYALLTASRLQTCRKFVICSNETRHRASQKNNILVWIMNETAHVAVGEYGGPCPVASSAGLSKVVKVLYSTDPEKIAAAWAKDDALEELELEPELVSAMHLSLAASTVTIPPSAREMSGGLLAGHLALH